MALNVVFQAAKCQAFLPAGNAQKVLLTLLYVFLYCLTGAIVYSNVEEKEVACSNDPDLVCTESWSTVDALYFSVVVMSTVGYGDLTPSTAGTQLFTVFYILVGILVVFSSVAECMGILLNPSIGLIRATLNKLVPPEQLDVDNSGKPDFEIPQPWYIFYPLNFLPSVLITVVSQQICAAFFLIWEDWSYGESTYHCYVTATTVGFGDVNVQTDGGKNFAIFHILLSVCLLGGFIADVDEVREERRTQLHREGLLKRKMDRDLIMSVMEFDRDGKGVDKFEFVTGMLTKLELVDWDDIRPFVAQFETLDKTGDGRLTNQDLEIICDGYAARAKATPKGQKRFNQVVATAKVTPASPTGSPLAAASPLPGVSPRASPRASQGKSPRNSPRAWEPTS